MSTAFWQFMKALRMQNLADFSVHMTLPFQVDDGDELRTIMSSIFPLSTQHYSSIKTFSLTLETADDIINPWLDVAVSKIQGVERLRINAPKAAFFYPFE